MFVPHIPNLLLSCTLLSMSRFIKFSKSMSIRLWLWALLCAKMVHMASATWILYWDFFTVTITVIAIVMIIMMIKYMPHAHFKVHKAPEANLCVCIISTVSCWEITEICQHLQKLLSRRQNNWNFVISKIPVGRCRGKKKKLRMPLCCWEEAPLS